MPTFVLGDVSQLSDAAQIVGRVLRPGGYAFIVTECFVDRHVLNSKLLQTGIRVVTLGRRCPNATPRRRAIDVFTPRELESRIVRPSGLELVQPLDRTITPSTRENPILMFGDGSLRGIA